MPHSDFVSKSVMPEMKFVPNFSFSENSFVSTCTEAYRYTFNGKETDTETDLQDYGMRIYNPRLGKFLSVDPISIMYPELTPYQFASNRPIDGIDLDGLEWQDIYGYGYASTYEQAEARGENGAAAVNSLVNAQFQGSLRGVALGIAAVAAIPTGGESMLVTFPLAMTNLGLETAKTIALTVDPNNQGAQTTPSTAIGVCGYGIDMARYEEAKKDDPNAVKTTDFENGIELVGAIILGSTSGNNPEEAISTIVDIGSEVADIARDGQTQQNAMQQANAPANPNQNGTNSNPAANQAQSAPIPPVPAAIELRKIDQSGATGRPLPTPMQGAQQNLKKVNTNVTAPNQQPAASPNQQAAPQQAGGFINSTRAF